MGRRTKQETLKNVNKRSLSLRLLAQSPGAAPSAPLQGCPIVWSSILKVGDSLAHQSFDVQADYNSLRFFYWTVKIKMRG